MSEYDNYSTVKLLDMTSGDGEITDILVERWAGLRSENQTLRAELTEVNARIDAVVAKNRLRVKDHSALGAGGSESLHRSLESTTAFWDTVDALMNYEDDGDE